MHKVDVHSVHVFIFHLAHRREQMLMDIPLGSKCLVLAQYGKRYAHHLSIPLNFLEYTLYIGRDVVRAKCGRCWPSGVQTYNGCTT